MSYEAKMLQRLAMPTREQVEQVLLRTLLKHGGVIREFGGGEEIVSEIAVMNLFALLRIRLRPYSYRNGTRSALTIPQFAGTVKISLAENRWFVKEHPYEEPENGENYLFDKCR